MKSDWEYWEERNRLERTLENLGLDVFEWLCLDHSKQWFRWDDAVGQRVFTEITWENYCENGIYLPDITESRMRDADNAICAAGLVTRVDSRIAKQMIDERQHFTNEVYAESDLCGLRVLSESGTKIWREVADSQGFRKGLNFIKKFVIGHTDDGQMVFHSPQEYRLELMCEFCAAAERNLDHKCFVEVGPWFEPEGQLWLSGWRLICPHCA